MTTLTKRPIKIAPHVATMLAIDGIKTAQALRKKIEWLEAEVFRLEAEVRSIPIYVSKAIEDFRKAIEDTVHDIFQQGLYGWQVTDCTVTMMDSDYSPPGSSASDFRYLSLLVLMNALKQVGTVVCEPISLLQH